MQSLKKIVNNGLIILGLSFGGSVLASSQPSVLSNGEIVEAINVIDEKYEKSTEQGNLEA